VDYISRYVTLMPGDIIYTGTPGTTKAMKPGDIVEIEIEGVGVLRNRIAGGTV
jgi:2-keto-4-pentenoate hydratase/2-oxohepta-3-ene-1,7-dioic acid hydratase in catechol pathway